MTTPAGAPASGPGAEASRPVWPTLGADRILQKDEGRTAFSLDAFSGNTFNIATGVALLTLVLATTAGPFWTFLCTTGHGPQQWLTCTSAAPPIIVAPEIRKTIRQRTAAGTVQAGPPAPSLVPAAAAR